MTLLTFFAVLYVGAILAPRMSGGSLDFSYHNYSQLEKYLHQVAQEHPNFATVYSIGRSVLGKELLALKLTAPTSSPVGTPHVKLIGNIHGNEVVGKEVLLHFIQYLLTTYSSDWESQNLLNNTVIHILPSLNPDGLEFAREGDCNVGPGRDNANRVDLNRSFPDNNRNNTIPRQPETLAVIQWMQMTQFVLSASLHGGALVANYPLDSVAGSRPGTSGLEFLEELEANGTSGELFLEQLKNFLIENGLNEFLTAQDGIYAASPDDDVFIDLAKTYSNNHPTMHLGPPCNDTPSFPGGITNGAAWYSLTGGMQDYNYFVHGCMELTLEISCCKYPRHQQLPGFWNENKKALIELVKAAHHGVRGQVLDAVTGIPVKGVLMWVENRDVNFSTSEQGEFWRILLPGKYTLQVKAPGYIPQGVPFTVQRLPYEDNSATWLTVFLQPVQPQRGGAEYLDKTISSASSLICFQTTIVTLIAFIDSFVVSYI